MLLGLALGVAPLVLLCPPPGVGIADRNGSVLEDNYSLLGFDEARKQRLKVGGSILVHGPWEPEWGPSKNWRPNPPFRTDDSLIAIKEWEREVWRNASHIPGLFSQEELDLLHDEALEWPERERLLAEAIGYLERDHQFKLDLVRGSWDLSEIEEGWRLDKRTLPQLRKWVEQKRAERGHRAVPPGESPPRDGTRASRFTVGSTPR